MNYAKKIPKLFFADFEQIELNKRNKGYSRFCKLLLWCWTVVMLPVSVRLSSIVKGYLETYSLDKMQKLDIVILSYFVPIVAFVGFILVLILYSPTLYNGRKAAVFASIIGTVSLVDTVFVCSVFINNSVALLITLSVSIILSIFLFFCTPGLVKTPGKVSTIISSIILAVAIIFALAIPFLVSYLNIDLSRFVKGVIDLFMKGG